MSMIYNKHLEIDDIYPQIYMFNNNMQGKKVYY